MTYIIPSNPERKWLYQHGGRMFYDIQKDTNGRKYVYMSDGHYGMKPVYIPEEYVEKSDY